MSLPFSLFVGLRYTKAKRKNHFISLISLISMVGIALGVMALIVVMSVMNGFQTEIRDRILGSASHVVVSSWAGMENWRNIKAQVDQNASVIGSAPFIEGQGMSTYGENVSGTLFRGVDPKLDPQVSDLLAHVNAGSAELSKGSYNVILGRELAHSIGASIGDKITVITPQGNVTAAGILPRFKRLTVSGIFEIGFHQVDRNIALMHIADASKLFRVKGATGLRLKLDDIFKAPQVSFELKNDSGGMLYAIDWTRSHSNIFKALKMEKTMMFIILALIISVAAFNIISTLVMVVTDKQSDIAVLMTLGAKTKQIMQVFIIQGCVIGVVGTVLGTATGLAIALNIETLVPAIENFFGVDFLDASLYYIAELPSEVQPADVYLVTGFSFLMSILATLYPAWKASTIDPAEALRYE